MRSSREPLRAQALAQGPESCVLVLLPGLGDAPARFRSHGFASAVSQSQAPCDVIVVDAHFGYYRDAVLPERLSVEVLSPLREQYQRVWLVGVSLGGYGAVLTAQARPDLVDGVVLISPFLGVPGRVRPLLQKVEAEGGLRAYGGAFARPGEPRRHFMEVEPLWQYLASRSRGARGPELVLAWGEDDGFAWKHRILGDSLGDDATFSAPGGHTWETFASLWRKVVDDAPWRG
jgi:pimeloyl-ACP methyl ester carboxylesterase